MEETEYKGVIKNLNSLAGILTEAGLINMGLEGMRKDVDLGYIYENRKGCTKSKFNETKEIFLSNIENIKDIILNQLSSSWEDYHKELLLKAFNLFIQEE